MDPVTVVEWVWCCDSERFARVLRRQVEDIFREPGEPRFVMVAICDGCGEPLRDF